MTGYSVTNNYYKMERRYTFTLKTNRTIEDDLLYKDVLL
jgi:hypothetical protein